MTSFVIFETGATEKTVGLLDDFDCAVEFRDCTSPAIFQRWTERVLIQWRLCAGLVCNKLARSPPCARPVLPFRHMLMAVEHLS
jgi:hypothetical protein